MCSVTLAQPEDFLLQYFETCFSYHKDIWIAVADYYMYFSLIVLSLLTCRVRNLKFATYLKFATCENTNKINELW